MKAELVALLVIVALAGFGAGYLVGYASHPAPEMPRGFARE